MQKKNGKGTERNLTYRKVEKGKSEKEGKIACSREENYNLKKGERVLRREIQVREMEKWGRS